MLLKPVIEETQHEPTIFYLKFDSYFLGCYSNLSMTLNLVSEIDWRDHPKTLVERTASQSDLWRKQKWGYPVRFSGGPGAEIFATFHPHLNK